MADRKIQDRQFETRTFFTFHFPNPGRSPTIVRLPLYENPNIVESKSANYQEYSLVSRSSSLFAYLGANAREFKISFNLTLPHLIDVSNDISMFRFIQGDILDDKAKARGLFKPAAIGDLVSAKWGPETRQASSARRRFEENSNQPINLGDSTQDRIIEILLWWTNIIRSSVLNRSDFPEYGPPIIKFTNGINFQEVPFICTKYNLNFDDTGGYDLKTMMNRVIPVSLDLKEIRTGDFGEFIPGHKVKGNNLAGFEAVLKDNTLDPRTQYFDI